MKKFSLLEETDTPILSNSTKGQSAEIHPGAPSPQFPNPIPTGFFPPEWIKKDIKHLKEMEEAYFAMLRHCQETIIKLQKVCEHIYDDLGQTHDGKDHFRCKICQHQKSE